MGASRSTQYFSGQHCEEFFTPANRRRAPRAHPPKRETVILSREGRERGRRRGRRGREEKMESLGMRRFIRPPSTNGNGGEWLGLYRSALNRVARARDIRCFGNITYSGRVRAESYLLDPPVDRSSPLPIRGMEESTRERIG